MYVFDYARRIRKFQETLAAQNAIAGVVMRAANIRYLSGFWGFASRAEYSEPRRLTCLIVPKSGTPLMIVPKIEYEFAKAATKGSGIEVRRHVEWVEEGETEDSWGLALTYMRELGLSSGIVSYEGQHLTSKGRAAVAAAFGKYQLLDGSGWIDMDRAVKDEVELDLLTACGTLAVEQYELQVKALPAKAWREYELALLGWEHVVHKCAEALGDNHVNSPIGEGVQLITSGPRLCRAHGSASCRHIQPNDVVMFDYCRVPYLLGYRMAMGRVVSLRKLNSEEQDIDAAITRAYKAGIAMVSPGASCSDIDSAIRRVLVDAGLAPFIVHRNGRGIGIEAVELPEIKEGSPDLRSEGMVISIEPSIYREGFASRIENAMIVTRDGPKLLTPAPTGVRVLN